MKRWARKVTLIAVMALLGVIFAASSASASQSPKDDSKKWVYYGTGNGAECVIYGYCGADRETRETLDIPSEIYVNHKPLRVIALRYDNRVHAPGCFCHGYEYEDDCDPGQRYVYREIHIWREHPKSCVNLQSSVE